MATLAEKLQLKPGQGLAVYNPPDGYLEKLQANLPQTELQAGDAPGAALLLFAGTLAEALQGSAAVFGAAQADRLVWIAYPKGGGGIKTDLNRDRLWQALAPSGWRPVRQVALDETWSAMRFRPAEQVGK